MSQVPARAAVVAGVSSGRKPQTPLKLKIARLLSPLKIAKLTRCSSTACESRKSGDCATSARYSQERGSVAASAASRCGSDEQPRDVRTSVDIDELADRRNIVFERFAGRMAESEPMRKSRIQRLRRSLGKSLAKRLPRVLVDWFRNMHRSRQRYSDRVADAAAADSEARGPLSELAAPRRALASHNHHHLYDHNHDHNHRHHQPPPPPPPPQAAARSLALLETTSPHRTSACASHAPPRLKPVLARAPPPSQAHPQHHLMPLAGASPNSSSSLLSPMHSRRSSSNADANFRRLSTKSSATAASRKSSMASAEPATQSQSGSFKARLPRSNVVNFAEVLMNSFAGEHSERAVEDDSDYEYADDDEGTMSVSSVSTCSPVNPSLLSQNSAQSNESEAAGFESESEFCESMQRPILASSASYNQNLHQRPLAGSRSVRDEVSFMAHSRSIQSQISRTQNGTAYVPVNSKNWPQALPAGDPNSNLTQRIACNGSSLRPIGAQPLAKRLSLQFSGLPFDEAHRQWAAVSREMSQMHRNWQDQARNDNTAARANLVAVNNELNFRRATGANLQRNSITEGEPLVAPYRSVSYVTNHRMFLKGLSSYEMRQAVHQKRSSLVSTASVSSLGSRLLRARSIDIAGTGNKLEKRCKTIANSNSFSSNSQIDAPVVKIVGTSQRPSLDSSKLASPVASIASQQQQTQQQSQQRVVIQVSGPHKQCVIVLI